MKKNIFCLLLFVAIKSFSQEGLPKFYTKILSNDKVQISWINPHQNCTQISIQRSYDSLKFFQTIFSSLSPELPQNGYVDNNYITQLNIFYRIFYVLDDGSFYFTNTINPKNYKYITTENRAKDTLYSNHFNDTIFSDTATINPIPNLQFVNIPKPVNNIYLKKIYTIYKRKITHLAYVIDELNFTKFKDSIANTKDTLVMLDNDEVIWNPYIPPPAWQPSIYIFTNLKGNVELNFPDYKKYKYKIFFYGDEQKIMFKLKQINYAKLIFDKGNFIKTGWYFFEVYKDDKLVEKNKFLLESDF